MSVSVSVRYVRARESDSWVCVRRAGENLSRRKARKRALVFFVRSGISFLIFPRIWRVPGISQRHFLNQPGRWMFFIPANVFPAGGRTKSRGPAKVVRTQNHESNSRALTDSQFPAMSNNNDSQEDHSTSKHGWTARPENMGQRRTTSN